MDLVWIEGNSIFLPHSSLDQTVVGRPYFPVY